MDNKELIRFVEHQFGKIFKRIRDLEEGFVVMAEDFTGLSAAVERAVSLINEAVTILKNPATDNNNQSVIDALTLRLTGAADALAGAEPAAPAPVAAPVEAPATTDAAPSDTPPAA
jgi:cobalamin-dependent methionine synthase I